MAGFCRPDTLSTARVTRERQEAAGQKDFRQRCRAVVQNLNEFFGKGARVALPMMPRKENKDIFHQWTFFPPPNVPAAATSVKNSHHLPEEMVTVVIFSRSRLLFSSVVHSIMSPCKTSKKEKKNRKPHLQPRDSS